MPLSIGIITASHSLENIRAADQKMRKYGRITYLPYSTFAELGSLYTKNARKFDGILFSGPLPKDYILENVGPISKPYRYLELEDRDFYLVIARLFASIPNIDFSRVYFDMIVDPGIFERVFAENPGPCSPNKSTPLEYRRFLRSPIYEDAFRQYCAYWREKKYDIIVTRYANLAEKLDREHIPHVFLQPSRETILEQYRALIGEIQASIIRNSLVACCIIGPAGKKFTDGDYEKTEKLLNEFNSRNNFSILIRRNQGCFELTTSSMEAREITSGYSSCSLADELRSKLELSICCGWGIGFDAASAYKNAKKALEECMKDKNRYPYLVTENREMIGPLSSNRSLSYALYPDAHIVSLSRLLGIAPINLEKLISLQKARNMYEFTSGDLVYYLEITPRSASRILQKLVQNGFARPVRQINLSGTGRPSTLYEIDFQSMDLYGFPAGSQ